MYTYPDVMEDLIEELRKLPSIGRKSAQRLALHIVKEDREKQEGLIGALRKAMNDINPCPICGNLTDQKICDICSDDTRDRSTICVVEDVTNLISIERSETYHGSYHVLDGLINPTSRVSPDDIGVDKFIDRINKEDIKEIIFAISPTLEGETTMLFLKELLKDRDIKMTRIASGIPVGGNLEYYDKVTLSKALEDRRDIGE